MSDWKTIDSAPKNGKRVMLASGRRFVGEGHFWRNANKRHPRERWVWNGWPKYEPTHWMPLPTPPVTGD